MVPQVDGCAARCDSERLSGERMTNPGQHFKFAAIQWRNDHLEHCSKECNVTMFDLMHMAQCAGAVFTEEERRAFTGNEKMEFVA